jgi:uncharacterized Tic20 family protein
MEAGEVSDPGRSQLTPDERSWGMLAHLSAFVGVILPCGNVLAPLLIWLARRERSAFVADQAREALNFNITVLVGVLVCYALTWILIGFLLFAVLGLTWLILTIVAAIRANEGVRYRYPFALRLVT